MDIIETPHKTQTFQPSDETTRSSLRMTYESEVRIFKSQHGDLENIRKRLGLSRRKMCQLLMVDPSAWTRWTKGGSEAPPHVYRALEWFLALNQKALTTPELAQVFLHKYPRGNDSSALAEEIRKVQGEIQQQRKISLALAAALGVLILTWLLDTLVF